MPVSAVPDVIDALIALAETALPDCIVSDGYGATDDVGDYLMVGVDDPDVTVAATSAASRQEWAHANYTARDENGEITCAALSWNGDGDQKAARDAVYAIAQALGTGVLDTPALGVPTLLWSTFGATLDLTQAQGPHGSSALLIFTITFRARL